MFVRPRATVRTPFLRGAVLAALIFAALAPAVSAWLASQGRVWASVCTTAGTSRLVLVSDAAMASDDAPDPAPGAGAHADCPYCLLQQHLAPPPALAAVRHHRPAPAVLRRWTVLALPYQAVAWAHRPAQAPPASHA